MTAGNVLPDAHALRFFRPAAAFLHIDDNLNSHHATQFGYCAAGKVCFACLVGLPCSIKRRVVPAQDFCEKF